MLSADIATAEIFAMFSRPQSLFCWMHCIPHSTGVLTAVEGEAISLTGGIDEFEEEDPESERERVEVLLEFEDEAEESEDLVGIGWVVVALDVDPVSGFESDPDPDEIRDLTASM
ncbi:unnamed protein product [Phytophthora fragariaefolia]|uniref:Unnamed protein product n=1 Tax=Phytophthora fragariaefolia TaxID=1490495 RepID=A0A9W7D9M7_9STRA|nr:unnamed protein product [Phytophthora fragariaefolia]